MELQDGDGEFMDDARQSDSRRIIVGIVRAVI
jgi:hypothetical protein